MALRTAPPAEARALAGTPDAPAALATGTDGPAQEPAPAVAAAYPAPEVAPGDRAVSPPAAQEPARAPAQQAAFMPPPPVAAPKPAPAATAPDPFRAAELVNGGPPATERRRMGLIHRMAETALGRRDRPEAVEKTAEIPAPRPAPARAETARPQPAPEPAPRPIPAQQARLDGVDPQDRLPSSQNDDDLLDIPAFLRRQAN